LYLALAEFIKRLQAEISQIGAEVSLARIVEPKGGYYQRDPDCAYTPSGGGG